MTTRFLFRCCSDVDEEDIHTLSGILPNFHSPNEQWYCAETEGDKMLAVCKVELDQSEDKKQFCTKNISFLSDGLSLSNHAGKSLPEYFFGQLTNAAAQNNGTSISLELTSYSDLLVSALERIGFSESGGSFSEELGLMVHTFLLKLDAAASKPESSVLPIELVETEPLGSSFTFEGTIEEIDFEPAPQMKALIGNLFSALHKEM